MAIVFPRVPEVVVGEAIASKQLAALAAAFNARLRSGLGDPTYRLAFWADSLARQIRNPDASQYLWPSRSEYLEVYSTIHPADFDYPLTEADTAEGINVETPLGEFVFGDEDKGVSAEDSRLLAVECGPANRPIILQALRWNGGPSGRRNAALMILRRAPWARPASMRPRTITG